MLAEGAMARQNVNRPRPEPMRKSGVGAARAEGNLVEHGAERGWSQSAMLIADIPSLL